MAHNCKGICKRDIYQPHNISGNTTYSMKEYRKCRLCYVAIKWSKRDCPCCGGPTSTRKTCKKSRLDVERY